MTGYTKTKYLAMAIYDISVHTAANRGIYNLDGENHDATSLFNAMMKKYTGIEQISDSFAGASWLHLMQGYDAGYYGYIYSECYAADLFGIFESLKKEANDGTIIDCELGRKYRDSILARGATKAGFDMLKDFLNRLPSKDSFFERVKK